MRSMNFLALRNLQQHRARTILSAISVALGTGAIVAISVLSSGVRSGWASGESALSFMIEGIDIAFTAVGIVILAAAGFLIFNAFAMAVTQQRRRIGIRGGTGVSRIG